MPKADFRARIRRIEIENRVKNRRFHQSLKIVLDEGEMSDGTLAALRHLGPGQPVRVRISPAADDEDLGPAEVTAPPGAAERTWDFS